MLLQKIDVKKEAHGTGSAHGRGASALHGADVASSSPGLLAPGEYTVVHLLYVILAANGGSSVLGPSHAMTITWIHDYYIILYYIILYYIILYYIILYYIMSSGGQIT